MNILDIYSQYNLPHNLRRHMLSVAALGSLLCDRLATIEVDKELIVKTLLLHDMGNILKMDFKRVDLFDEGDRRKLDTYRKSQQSFLNKYGSNPDEATLEIIKEVTSNQKIAKLCEASHWMNLPKYIDSNRWDIKICTYSDMRVGPFGLLTLSERMRDLQKRRPEEKVELDTLLQQGLLVEEQLMAATKQRLSEIDIAMVEMKVQEFRDQEFQI